MRISVDIGHPAHVHLFRNFILIMRRRGHIVYITTRRVQSIIDLLNIYKINYFSIGKKPDSLIFKYIYQLYSVLKLIYITIRYKIEIGLGVSMTLPIASKFTKMKCIGLDDDDKLVTPVFAKYIAMSDVIITPECLLFEKRGVNHITHKSFHELAYLHPNRFKPESTILDEVDLNEEAPFFIMRFNIFKAHHDKGIQGLSLKQKLVLIQVLKDYGKIFITTEREIEPELKNFQLKISPDKIHSLIHYATMLIGDSQTMTSESAVLGIPAIRMNSFVGRISYLEEEEHKYALTYGFKPDQFDEMILKIEELLKMPNLKQEWQKRRKKMLEDKIDITAFLVWFVENYPNSAKIMKENPDYQYRFKGQKSEDRIQ